MNCWKVLGIDPGSDKRQIRRAYANALKTCHPEDNPEGFMQLRHAFEIANSYVDNESWSASHFASTQVEIKEGDAGREPDDSVIEAIGGEGLGQFEESAAVADLLDNLTGYSDVVPPKRDGQLDCEDRSVWAQEYAELLNKLDLIINSPSLIVDINQWQQLFASPLIRGHVYRVDFCMQLLTQIKERLDCDKYQHLFSPEVILCITDFVQGSLSFDDAREISNEWAVAIATLAKKTSRFINRRKARQDWKKYLFRRFVWTFFSFKGRLRRRSFLVAFVTLIVSVTIYSEGMVDRQLAPGEMDAAAVNDSDQMARAAEVDSLAVMPETVESVDTLFPSTARNPILEKPYALDIYKDPVFKDISRQASAVQDDNSQDALGISGLRALEILMVTGLFLWIAAALIIKRVHDMGNSYLSLLFLLIPYINIGFMLMLMFNKDDDNRHGISSNNEIKNLWWFRRAVYNELRFSAAV